MNRKKAAYSLPVHVICTCKLVCYWHRQPQPQPDPVSFVSTGTQTDITQSEGPIQLRPLSCSPQLPEPDHPSGLSPHSEPQPPAVVGCGELAQPPTNTVERTRPTNSNNDASEPLETSPSLPLLTNPKIPLKLRQGRASSTPHKMSLRIFLLLFSDRVLKGGYRKCLLGLNII
jgi:hypothetical protein